MFTYLYYLIFSKDWENINVNDSKKCENKFEKPQGYKNINSNSITNF